MTRPPPPAACWNCRHAAPRYRKNRCDPCYMYWWRHGVERPARCWTRVAACVHCGVPWDGLVRDRCHACYAYLWKHGVDRPLDLIARYWARTA